MYLKSTPIQMLPPGGSVFRRLTSDFPLGCLQGGSACALTTSEGARGLVRVHRGGGGGGVTAAASAGGRRQCDSQECDEDEMEVGPGEGEEDRLVACGMA